jgi:pilus assembly protein CpaB
MGVLRPGFAEWVMKPARILLLVVALVAGGLAAFLATRGTAPVTEQVTKIEKEARVQILVASKPIGVGERLNAGKMQWQDWPEGALQSGYVTIKDAPDAIENLNNVVARFEIFKGEPIRENKLARVDRGYLSAVIEPGMRAVSINVTAASSAGGFVIPNDRVDVVLTRRANGSQQSETILTDIKVLAIGQRLGEVGLGSDNDEEATDPKSQAFQKATIATLELDPVQAETLVNASEAGTLALVLRSVADFNAANTTVSGARTNATVRMVRYGRTQNVLTGADAPASSFANGQAPFNGTSGEGPDGATESEPPDQVTFPEGTSPEDQNQSQ